MIKAKEYFYSNDISLEADWNHGRRISTSARHFKKAINIAYLEGRLDLMNELTKEHNLNKYISIVDLQKPYMQLKNMLNNRG